MYVIDITAFVYRINLGKLLKNCLEIIASWFSNKTRVEK